jgi:hypothetical protein
MLAGVAAVDWRETQVLERGFEKEVYNPGS